MTSGLQYMQVMHHMHASVADSLQLRVVYYYKSIIIGSDRRPETKQEIGGKIVQKDWEGLG